jgi:hypothetical protein
VLALVSCATGPTTPSEIAIPGITWKLRSIQRAGSVTIDIPVPERFTVLFRDDQRAVVRADCNTCTGRYELSGSNLPHAQRRRNGVDLGAVTLIRPTDRKGHPLDRPRRDRAAVLILIVLAPSLASASPGACSRLRFQSSHLERSALSSAMLPSLDIGYL